MDKIRGSIYVAYGIFVFEVLELIYFILDSDIVMINSLFKILNDASFFLTILSIVFILISLVVKPKAVQLILMSLFNIILVNDLYSNTTLAGIYEFISDWIKALDAKEVFYIILVMVIMISIFITLYRRNVKKNVGHVEGKEIVSFEENKQQETLAERMDYNSASTIQNGGLSSTEDIKDNLEKLSQQIKKTDILNENVDQSTIYKKEYATKGKGSILESIIWIPVGLVFWAIIDYGLYSKGILKREREIGWLPNVLQPLAIFCLAIVLTIGIKKAVRVIGDFMKSDDKDTKEYSMRTSSFLALAFELFFIIVLKSKESNGILDDFLDKVTNNNLIALMAIPIVLFLIFHIAVSVVFDVIVGKHNNEISKSIREYIEMIERGLVKFVGNLFIGIINLLLFIPDFFNTIGVVLLDRESIFPNDKISMKTNNPNESDCSKEGTTEEKKANGEND